MSVSKWAYTPEMCDGDICVGDCDLCDKPKIAQIHNTATTQVQTDYIKREDAQDIIARKLSDYITDEERWILEYVDGEIGDIPSADVVEVVRCKDCKYMLQYEQIKACCNMNSFFQEPKLVSDNDFCSRGERKDD